MSRFTVLLGGDVVPTPRLAAQIAGTRAIAADSGIRHAETLGIFPDLWVGDFDSVPESLDRSLAGVERRSFPKEKDQTDGELALHKALERGATSIVFVGAFGGPRFDHSFLHVALAIQLAEKGVSALLTSGAQEGTPLGPKPHQFDYVDGTVFSVLGFSDLVGMTLEGARWPLDRVKVPFGSSWTVSNEVAGHLVVTLQSGRAILLAHPFPAENF